MFTLALALGRNLNEILSLPIAEFNAWRTYYNVSPFGDVRNDLQSGVVASVITNVNTSRGSKVFAPSDFVIDFLKEPLTADEIIERKLNKFTKDYR